MIRIYTDGAAQGNPGPGGYGVILKWEKHNKELSQGYRLTTNNRMELMAVIAGLKAIRKLGIPVTIYSDSKYVTEAVNQGWIWGWEKIDFKKKANADLWKEYIQLHHRFHPKFIWIKGHAGHPENERCDLLAVYAAQGDDLLADEGYEQSARNAER
ncbi:MAG: ribonuclease HI [Bacteroidetes bacterium]|nr:ribonuclease HI [Bacteroidota bacterium]MBS1976510.1 ribonuclease HI [Bacteroidota bacterium]